MFRGCLTGVRRCWGVLRVYFGSETAQVELNIMCQKRLRLGGQVDECKPLPSRSSNTLDEAMTLFFISATSPATTSMQGLTLVHFSAQL